MRVSKDSFSQDLVRRTEETRFLFVGAPVLERRLSWRRKDERSIADSGSDQREAENERRGSRIAESRALDPTRPACRIDSDFCRIEWRRTCEKDR